MEEVNTFDFDKYIQANICIYNACMIAAMFVTIEERLQKLSTLLELIAGSISLKEVIPVIIKQAKFFGGINAYLSLPAAMSMETANNGKKLFTESFLTPEWNSKARRYIDMALIDNYRGVAMTGTFLKMLDGLNKQLNAILLSTKYEVEHAKNDEQKKKSTLAVKSIAEIKCQISFLHEAFNLMLEYYYY